MRTAAALMLALGVSFGALVFAAAGAAPGLAQDEGALDGGPPAVGSDVARLEEREDLLPPDPRDEQPYGGVYGQETDDGPREAEAWWGPTPEDEPPGADRGRVGCIDDGDAFGLDAPDDDGLDAWLGESDEAR